jgi:hypothetical protein
MTEVPCRAYVRLVQSHAAAHALTLRTVADLTSFTTPSTTTERTLSQHTTAPRLCAHFKIAWQTREAGV